MRSILLLATVSEHPPAATLKRLEHEYALEGELRSAWAAQPVALTEHQGWATLVLEDPGGEPLDGLLRAPMEVGLFLRVAVGLVVALRQLHAQGIIHKDVKPANLLVDTATGGVWLMGFGIASTLRRERQAPEPPDIIARSLHRIRWNGCTAISPDGRCLPRSGGRRSPVRFRRSCSSFWPKRQRTAIRPRLVWNATFAAALQLGRTTVRSTNSGSARTTRPTGSSFPRSSTGARARSRRCSPPSIGS